MSEKKETHLISVEVKKFITCIEIKVDNTPIVKKGIILKLGKDDFNFEVGNREKHKVRVVLNFKIFWAYRGVYGEAFVDGRTYKTFKV